MDLQQPDLPEDLRCHDEEFFMPETKLYDAIQGAIQEKVIAYAKEGG